eukprot:177000-Ditylum_brightwellii.AAC.1
MIKELGSKGNMTGFADDLVKNNIPTGSGLTKGVNKATGFQFLLGLHEAQCLKNNEGSLLSTNQSHEIGDQRLVAPVENSKEILDMHLEVKDGLWSLSVPTPLIVISPICHMFGSHQMKCIGIPSF